MLPKGMYGRCVKVKKETYKMILLLKRASAREANNMGYLTYFEVFLGGGNTDCWEIGCSIILLMNIDILIDQHWFVTSIRYFDDELEMEGSYQ